MRGYGIECTRSGRLIKADLRRVMRTLAHGISDLDMTAENKDTVGRMLESQCNASVFLPCLEDHGGASALIWTQFVLGGGAREMIMQLDGLNCMNISTRTTYILILII